MKRANECNRAEQEQNQITPKQYSNNNNNFVHERKSEREEKRATHTHTPINQVHPFYGGREFIQFGSCVCLHMA